MAGAPKRTLKWVTENRKKARENQKYWKRVRGLLRFLFSRTTFLVAFLLVQLAVLFAGFKWLGDYLFYVYGGYGILTVIVVVNIINRPMNSNMKLSWIVPILATPVFGALFYLYVRADLLTKELKNRLTNLHRESLPYRKEDKESREKLALADVQTARLAEYLKKHGDFSVYENTQVEYFSLGEHKWGRLLEELKKAEKFIFLEYFIVGKGKMWDAVLEILKEKAANGVEVRVMYDGTNAIANVPFSYPRELNEFGIKCRVFSELRPFLSTVQNNRDHRKIVVIDGHTGFTGGINLADEYINQRVRFGHWKDTAIMLKGEAVQSLTLMFLEMWNVEESKMERWGKYCPYYPENKMGASVEESGYVIPYCDSPLDHEQVGELVYLDILNTAKNYVHIMTPYLILDDETIMALSFAAKRGVETIIMMPHVPDKEFAYLLARTYYPELLSAGVQIFEYTPGFIHAKSFVSDDIKAVVGTINLDYRSLYLHFECAAFLYGCPAVADVEADFQETLKKCQRITLEDCKRYPTRKRILGKLLRLVAPLM